MNEPIFSSDIKVEGISDVNVRRQLGKLVDMGLINRYDTGIYYIPTKSIFKSGSQLSPEKVLECKYLKNKGELCGYMSGLMFFNQTGLTSQIPMQFEVVSNKATTDYRETSLAKTRVVIRKPKVPITKDNYKILQFLDLMKDVDEYAEVTGAELSDRLIAYMKRIQLCFSQLEPYLQFYPDKIYKNMYKAGILHGIPA
ncbi:MAG: hypothetical protein LUE92_06675 [Clostridiales bacterium]|nr:hypothetical protein [Clostridiales bacterium]